MNLGRITVGQLSGWATVGIDWILSSVSYEKRSPVVRSNLPKGSYRHMVFFNENHAYNMEALAEAKALLHDIVDVPLQSDTPLASLDSMREAISGHIGEQTPASIVIDITCFTRESLAMLMMTLKHLLHPKCTITCLYTTARSYAYGPKVGEHYGWLTRGIFNVRSILGFRGRVSLMADTHLILLPGFETERAHGIIEAVQPTRLTVGQISLGESVRAEFATHFDEMNERLESYYPDQQIAHVAFSAKDPFLTKTQILECVKSEDNTIIACLNTKLAMMGVILAALHDSTLQLAYAQPVQYNLRYLSETSDELLAFELPLWA